MKKIDFIIRKVSDSSNAGDKEQHYNILADDFAQSIENLSLKELETLSKFLNEYVADEKIKEREARHV